MMDLPPKRRVRWRRTYRVIATRYPPIALFERVADPADWEALVEVASLTNPRIRDEIGEIALVSVSERVSGPGASYVMAPFTHIGAASRFTDGTYGVYYTARSQQCAVAETAYHYGRFYASTGEHPCEVDMRLLIARIDGVLHDLRGLRDPTEQRDPNWRRGQRDRERFAPVYDLDDYSASQRLGRTLREQGANGIAYDSVRLAGDHCAALFRPTVVKDLPRGDRHLRYHFDGTRIDRYFDYADSCWVPCAPSPGATH